MERFTYNDQGCWTVTGTDGKLCENVCREQNDHGCDLCPIAHAVNKLAEYENAIEQGMLIWRMEGNE